MSWWEEFPTYIRSLRGEMPQKEFGVLIGVDRSVVSHMESGRRRPTVDTLIRISRHFNISINELLNV